VLPREPASCIVDRANARPGRWDHRGVKWFLGSASFQRRPDNSSTIRPFMIAAGSGFRHAVFSLVGKWR
jgi:hypothetical protein